MLPELTCSNGVSTISFNFSICSLHPPTSLYVTSGFSSTLVEEGREERRGEGTEGRQRRRGKRRGEEVMEEEERVGSTVLLENLNLNQGGLGT